MAGLMAEVARFSFLAFMAAMIIEVGLAADKSMYKLVGYGCSNKTTYTYVNATVFQENLEAALASLRSNLSSDSFATSMEIKAGKSDPVYALAVCRKYLSADQCAQCINNASSQVKANCPQSNGARIHLDGCFLRYENSTFFDQPVDGGFSSSCPSSANGSDSQSVQAISTQLIKNASANKGYAVGSNIDGSLYGLAQCWPSLTTNGCQTCLTEAGNLSLACVPNLEGRGLEAGCFMRYSNYSFFTDN